MSDLELTYSQISDESSDLVAFVTINRPQVANALSFDLMTSFVDSLKQVEANKFCRAIVIKAKGKHFSSGADLSWMQAAQKMSHQENYEEALILTEMFEKLYHSSKPTIALVKGAAYGGALGLICACDSVICCDNAKFSLSEVKLGLIPAVILPYLARKIRPGDLRRLSLTGAVFSAHHAKEIGLANFCVPEGEISVKLKSELSLFLGSGPRAIADLKKLYHEVSSESNQQSERTAKSISQIRVGDEAQHGLSSFFAKKKPSWVVSLKEGWEFDV